MKFQDVDREQIPCAVPRSASLFGFESPDHEKRAKELWLDDIRRITGRTSTVPDDVIIRGARIVNSKRDFYYSRFTLDALDDVAALLPGRPLMMSHDYRSLPVGRWFMAQRTKDKKEKVERDSHWVEGLFFLPNDDEGQRIAKRIDQNIYAEVSLGWRFLDSPCSICKKDVMSMDCPHQPGEVYEKGMCEFGIDSVTDVIEGSLVFAGGQKGTQTYAPPGERSGLREALVEAPIFQRVALVLKTKEKALHVRGPGRYSGERDQALRNSIQSITFKRELYADQELAARWAREHGFRSKAVEVLEGAFAFRQFEAERCERGSNRVIELDPGVSAVACKRTSAQRDPLGYLFVE